MLFIFNASLNDVAPSFPILLPGVPQQGYLVMTFIFNLALLLNHSSLDLLLLCYSSTVHSISPLLVFQCCYLSVITI